MIKIYLLLVRPETREKEVLRLLVKKSVVPGLLLVRHERLKEPVWSLHYITHYGASGPVGALSSSVLLNSTIVVVCVK